MNDSLIAKDDAQDARRYRWLSSMSNTIPLTMLLKVSYAIKSSDKGVLDKVIDECIAKEEIDKNERLY